jgi:hypothetical protein
MKSLVVVFTAAMGRLSVVIDVYGVPLTSANPAPLVFLPIVHKPIRYTYIDVSGCSRNSFTLHFSCRIYSYMIVWLIWPRSERLKLRFVRSARTRAAAAAAARVEGRTSSNEERMCNWTSERLIDWLALVQTSRVKIGETMRSGSWLSSRGQMS